MGVHLIHTMNRFNQAVAICWVVSGILGCSPSSPQMGRSEDKVSTAEVRSSTVAEDCDSIELILQRCDRIPEVKQAVPKIIAVLHEQLEKVPKIEQSKMCQEVVGYWQAACGESNKN